MTPDQIAARDRIAGYVQLQETRCFCGAVHGWSREVVDRHDFDLSLTLCVSCGLLRTDPYPTPESLERFYREDYRTLYSPEGNEAFYNRQRDKGHQLDRQMFRRLPISSVIDYGCGAGGTLEAFADRGLTCTGVDMDPGPMNYGRSRLGDKAELITEYDGRTADLVMAIHTIEHRTDLREAIEQHAAMVNPGGYLYIEVPVLRTIPLVYLSLSKYAQLAHAWHFTDATLTWVLGCCGVDVIASATGSALCRAGEKRALEPQRGEALRTMAELLVADDAEASALAMQLALEGLR